MLQHYKSKLFIFLFEHGSTYIFIRERESVEISRKIF
jgi:hypothetical protein